MADRSILFSVPMVRAILAGTKTQTRRVLKPWPGMQRKWLSMETLHSAPTCYLCEVGGHLGAQMQHPLAGTTQSYGPVDKMSPLGWVRLPYSVGDRLWVREAWRTLHSDDCLSPRHLAPDPSKITFEADPENRNPLWAFGRLRPGMFMPRWASRLTLTVTDVRVERLQDISEEDALAEGVVDTGRRDGAPYQHFLIPGMPEITTEHEPSPVFAGLWESINGPGAWAENPWVAAYTFTVEHRNIDAEVLR